MKPINRTTHAILLLISIPVAAGAQHSKIADPPMTAQKISIISYSPGPLTAAASTPAFLRTGNMIPIDIRNSSVAMRQYGIGRLDWELGRAWIGTVIGFAYAYISDLIIHYESEFSKGHYLFDEERNGDNVFNALLYCGIPPYYAMRGVRSVNIRRKNSLGSYITGLIGSAAGMIYWTDLGDSRSLKGFMVYTGLTTLFADIGYHIF